MSKRYIFFSIAALIIVNNCSAMKRNVGWDQQDFARARAMVVTPDPPKALTNDASRCLVQQEWGSEKTRIACMKVLNRMRKEEMVKLDRSRDLAKKILDIIDKRKKAHRDRNTLGWDY